MSLDDHICAICGDEWDTAVIDPDGSSVCDACNDARQPEVLVVAQTRTLATLRAQLATTEAKRDRLREYERATRDTVCWGVECVHEAKALDMLYSGQRERDEMREQLATARAALETIYCGEPYCGDEQCGLAADALRALDAAGRG